jgi:anti-sigma B factor antagonist
VAWAGRRAVVAFPEQVDMSTAAQIREQLLAALDGGAAVVIADMSATAWCDNVGVDALVRACQLAEVRRAELRLVATSPAVHRLLAADGLDRLVPVYSSLEAAIAAGEPDGPDTFSDSAPPVVALRRPARLQDGQEDGPGPAPVNEAILRQLIDALADGIVLADEDGRIVLANRQAAAMFGYQPAELAGQLVESLIQAAGRAPPGPGCLWAQADSPAYGRPGPAGRAAQGWQHHPGGGHAEPGLDRQLASRPRRN